MNCSWELICYILSISLQVSGALMLIVFTLSTERKDVIRDFAKSHLIVRDSNTKDIIYNHDAFVETYRSKYFAKASVGFIAAGYIIGVFGDIGINSRWIVATIIIVLTVILILITRVIIEKLLQEEKVSGLITNEELVSAGVEPDIKYTDSQFDRSTLILGGIEKRSQ